MEGQVAHSGASIVDHIAMVLITGIGATINMMITWFILDNVVFRRISVSRAISGVDRPDGITNIGVALVTGLMFLGVGLGSFILAAFLPGWVLHI